MISYYCSSFHLAASHLLFSPLFDSPRNAKHLLSSTYVLLKRKNSTARNQKQQNFNLIVTAFLLYIHPSTIYFFALFFQIVSSIFISSPLTFTSLICSHRFSFLPSRCCHLSCLPMCDFLLSLATSCGFLLSRFVF